MRIEKPLLDARLVRRYKRFLADVELADGTPLTVHCPNPGRLAGCLPDAARVVLRDSEDPRRKLRYTLQTIRVGRHWVNVDTSLPNAVVDEALGLGRVPELAGYASRRREVAYGRASRVDLLLEDPRRGRCFVEVKCTTLVEGNTAMFPDAVTARGLGHLAELAAAARAGDRAVILFFVSRADARSFAPADQVDPAFGRGLREALSAGVEALAYGARVSPASIELGPRLELRVAPLETINEGRAATRARRAAGRRR